MSIFKKLVDQITSKNRRRAPRMPSPDLAAFYWTNAAPVEHSIRDISASGLFLVTEERWYPGTLIMLTLQRKSGAETGPEKSISVQSKAVRWGEDGVGLEFILLDHKDPRRGQSVLSDGVDRKTLEKFLASLSSEQGSATIGRVTSPID